MAEATQDTKNLYQRIIAIMDEVGAIEKTGRNTQQNYAFIEQAMVVASLRPLLVKHGVVIIPNATKTTTERFETLKEDKYGKKTTVSVHVQVETKYRVINADNPEEFFESEWAGEALDYSDKATNKAHTASQKTYLMKLFNISDKEDPDKETIEAPSATTKASQAMDEQKEVVDAVNSIMADGPAPASSSQLLSIKAKLTSLKTPPEARDKVLSQIKTAKQAEDTIQQLDKRIAEKNEG